MLGRTPTVPVVDAIIASLEVLRYRRRTVLSEGAVSRLFFFLGWVVKGNELNVAYTKCL